jgi:hypothetical protein
VERRQHPEAALYERHQAAWPLPHQAVAQWRADGLPIVVADYGLSWTVGAAENFVGELVQLFQVYNQVLWERFSYCRECGGQCCVVDASDVRLFDLLALALSAETPPALPAQISAGHRACIYLVRDDGGVPHCSWPAQWRTIKCWSFYCLGSGPWPAAADPNQLHRELAAALYVVVEQWLPTPLRRYEQITQTRLTDRIEDPVDFANGFHKALNAIFVEPFCRVYPLADQGSLGAANSQVANLFLLEEEVGEFITNAMSTLAESPVDSPATVDEQLWSDLELLAWLVETRPPNVRAQLQLLAQRYGYPDSSPLARQLRAQLVRLLAVWRG